MTGSPGERLAMVVAAAVASYAVVRACTALTRRQTSWRRVNFRGREVTLAGGLAAVVVTSVSAGVLALVAPHLVDAGLGRDVRRVALATAVAATCAGVVGLYDDLAGDPTAKGFRGHLGALRAGRVTSGLVKVVVIVAGAAAAALILGEGRAGPQQLVDAGVVAGSANMANLLDLRPGRALKAVVAVSLPVAAAAGPAAGLLAAWPAGTAAGLLPADLRERTMLGDGGANALGSATGVALAAAGGLVTSAVVLAALVLATAASEAVSFSALIERNPVLRRLDLLGRLP